MCELDDLAQRSMILGPDNVGNPLLFQMSGVFLGKCCFIKSCSHTHARSRITRRAQRAGVLGSCPHLAPPNHSRCDVGFDLGFLKNKKAAESPTHNPERVCHTRAMVKTLATSGYVTIYVFLYSSVYNTAACKCQRQPTKKYYQQQLTVKSRGSVRATSSRMSLAILQMVTPFFSCSSQGKVTTVHVVMFL